MSTRPNPRPPASRRRRKRSPPPTEWRQVVAAIGLTLFALGSWAYASRGPAGSDALSGRGPTEAASEGERPSRHFTIVAAGDVLIHSPVSSRAAENAGGSGYDFDPMFEQVAPLIREADLAICHMETPISQDNSDVASYPIFNAPHEIADALAHAGFDLCSTASNHSYDKGSAGVKATLKALHGAGIRTEGTATGRGEAHRAEMMEVNQVRVAHLSFTYGLNGLQLPKGEGYLVDVAGVKKILRRAADAKSSGAEFVVLSMHWGQEFQTEPTPEQRSWARKLLRSDDVDLILGHHAHVPQAVGRVGDEFVIFGMGNLISNQRPGATATCCLPETQDGLLIGAEVRETTDGWRTSVFYRPTWVRPETFEVLPVARALGDRGLSPLAPALRESWRRTVATVNSMGARRAGVRPAEKP